MLRCESIMDKNKTVHTTSALFYLQVGLSEPREMYNCGAVEHDRHKNGLVDVAWCYNFWQRTGYQAADSVVSSSLQ